MLRVYVVYVFLFVLCMCVMSVFMLCKPCMHVLYACMYDMRFLKYVRLVNACIQVI